jgi:hypothetical protein
MLFVDIPRTYEKQIGKTIYVVTSEPKQDSRDTIFDGFYRLITRDIESIDLLESTE